MCQLGHNRCEIGVKVLLNGWGYKSDSTLDLTVSPHAQSQCPPSLEAQSKPHTYASLSDSKYNSIHTRNSHIVTLVEKSLPANQLCNIICQKHTHRDSNIQDIIVLRQQLRKEKLTLARMKRAETN